MFLIYYINIICKLINYCVYTNNVINRFVIRKKVIKIYNITLSIWMSVIDKIVLVLSIFVSCFII